MAKGPLPPIDDKTGFGRATSPDVVHFDAAAVSPYEAALSTYAFDLTIGPQANRLLLIGVSIFAAGTVTSIDVSGQAATFVRADAQGVYRTEIWRLTAPTSGVRTITVNLSLALTSVAGAVCYWNADQSTPVEANAGAAGTGPPALGSVTTVKADARVFGVLSTLTAGGVTDASIQTRRFTNTGALGTGIGADIADIPTAQAMFLQWNGIGSLDAWAASFVSVRPLQPVTTYEYDGAIDAQAEVSAAVAVTAIPSASVASSSTVAGTEAVAWAPPVEGVAGSGTVQSALAIVATPGAAVDSQSVVSAALVAVITPGVEIVTTSSLAGTVSIVAVLNAAVDGQSGIAGAEARTVVPAASVAAAATIAASLAVVVAPGATADAAASVESSIVVTAAPSASVDASAGIAAAPNFSLQGSSEVDAQTTFASPVAIIAAPAAAVPGTSGIEADYVFEEAGAGGAVTYTYAGSIDGHSALSATFVFEAAPEPETPPTPVQTGGGTALHITTPSAPIRPWPVELVPGIVGLEMRAVPASATVGPAPRTARLRAGVLALRGAAVNPTLRVAPRNAPIRVTAASLRGTANAEPAEVATVSPADMLAVALLL